MRVLLRVKSALKCGIMNETSFDVSPMLVLIVDTFTFSGDPAAEALKKHVRRFLIQGCHIVVATFKYVFWRLYINTSARYILTPVSHHQQRHFHKLKQVSMTQSYNRKYCLLKFKVTKIFQTTQHSK